MVRVIQVFSLEIMTTGCESVRVELGLGLGLGLGGGGYFLRLHTLFSIVGVMTQPHSLG